MESNRILITMLKMVRFTVSEVVEKAGAADKTVRSVLDRHAEFFDREPAPPTGRRGGRVTLYTVRPDTRDALVEKVARAFSALPQFVELQLNSKSSWPADDFTTSPLLSLEREPEEIPAALLAAEHDIAVIAPTLTGEDRNSCLLAASKKLHAAASLIAEGGFSDVVALVNRVKAAQYRIKTALAKNRKTALNSSAVAREIHARLGGSRVVGEALKSTSVHLFDLAHVEESTRLQGALELVSGEFIRELKLERLSKHLTVPSHFNPFLVVTVDWNKGLQPTYRTIERCAKLWRDKMVVVNVGEGHSAPVKHGKPPPCALIDANAKSVKDLVSEIERFTHLKPVNGLAYMPVGSSKTTAQSEA